MGIFSTMSVGEFKVKNLITQSNITYFNMINQKHLVGDPANGGSEYNVEMGYRALGLNFGLVCKPN
jgi:hypothetical protein